LSKIPIYSIYPNHHWSKPDVGPKEKYLYIGFGIFYSTILAMVTYWMVSKYIPTIKPLDTIFAMFNGIIIFFPLARNFWVLKF
jgi:hypothetical protein